MSMSKNTIFKLAPISVAALMLAGCFGGGDDNNDSAPATKTGVAVDFYISGGTVSFANPACASTTTDASGKFTIPNGSCGAATVTGGTDTATKLPFKGSLSAPEGATVISPVTTLVQALIASGKTSAEAKTIVNTSLGLTKDSSTTDPLSDPDALGKAQALVQIAQQTAESVTKVSTASFASVFAKTLESAAKALPATGPANITSTSFLQGVITSTGTSLSLSSTLSANLATIITPTVASIAQSAEKQITDIKAQLTATGGDAAKALSVVTTQSNIDDNIKSLTEQSTKLGAEVTKVSTTLATATTNELQTTISNIVTAVTTTVPAPVVTPTTGGTSTGAGS
jgi:hypothetical protein